MLFDTHAHVNFKSFEADASETIGRALEAGVQVVNVGTQLDTSKQCVALAERYDGVYAVVGLHPVHTYSQHVDEEETHFKTREETFDYEAYKKIAEHSKVVGIGECGLDYFRLPVEKYQVESSKYQAADVKELQKAAFKEQIKLALELNKALVIHSRSSAGTDDACVDIIEILKDQVSSFASLRFVTHSYTGSPEVLQKFLDLGGYVSFNGIVTFDKTGNMEKLVTMAPLDKILLETDCPYLTPIPHRGKRNEPAYVQHVAEKVAKIKNVSFEEVTELTTANARNLFLV